MDQYDHERPGANGEHMKRGTTIAAMVVLALSIGTAAGEDANADANDSKLDVFKKHAEPIGRLIKLGWRGERLQLDRDHWGGAEDIAKRIKRQEQMVKKLMARGLPEKFARKQAEQRMNRAPVEEAFAKLRQAAGSFRSGMSGRGGILLKQFSGNDLTGQMTQGNGELVIRVTELLGDGRSIVVSDATSGEFGLNLIDPSGETILVLHQGEDGKVKLVHVDGETMKHLSAESFLELYAEHSEYCNKTLFPAIRATGVKLPLGPYDERIISAVVSRLRGHIDNAERKRIHKALDELEASDYPTRQEATKRLLDNYVRWRPVILKEMKERQLSREAKSRLESVITANTDVNQSGQLMDALGLLKDPAYLVEILGRTKDDGRKVVLDQLRKVTKQDIGDDVKAWRAWLKQREDGKK
jgi:hypothetical protein